MITSADVNRYSGAGASGYCIAMQDRLEGLVLRHFKGDYKTGDIVRECPWNGEMGIKMHSHSRIVRRATVQEYDRLRKPGLKQMIARGYKLVAFESGWWVVIED